MLVIVREKVRNHLINLRVIYLKVFWKHCVAPTVRVPFSAFLDKTAPANISIGEHTIITRGAMVLSHDFSRRLASKTSIPSNCLIGVNAIILPGVTIGNEVVVGAGSVVARDVPSNSLVAGNPAKVIKSIKTGFYGQIEQK